KHRVDVDDVKISGVPIEPRGQPAGVFERFAPLALEEDRGNACVHGLAADAHRQSAISVRIRRGDHYVNVRGTQGVAHLHHCLAWATVAWSYRRNDMQDVQSVTLPRSLRSSQASSTTSNQSRDHETLARPSWKSPHSCWTTPGRRMPRASTRSGLRCSSQNSRSGPRIQMGNGS